LTLSGCFSTNTFDDDDDDDDNNNNNNLSSLSF